eukprot:TRINITY_DN73774_c0_g1_i1.p1 TRINITY_DN73774_c0_g1~~TRINITY_DN73774_c0_g1_i1.p1  ORF type:complete len:398 (-),score=89.86 TRINITY_DN73774_c0_g1_i1:16-1170(-)
MCKGCMGWDGGCKGMGTKGCGKGGQDPMMQMMLAKGKAKGKGKAAIKISMGEPAFVGRVRTFDASRDAGTIACPEVYAMSSQEVYVHKSILESKKADLGDTLVFLLHWNSRGQPQCSLESIRIHSAQGSMALKGKFKAGNDPGKPFGFIESTETFDFFSRDVYVPKELTAGLTSGQFVSFNVKINRDMQPSVTELAPVDESWEPAAPQLTETKEDPNVPAPWAEGASSVFSAGANTKKRTISATSTGEFFTAVFKAFNEKNGWGFVGSEELQARFGADVFAHSRELTNVVSKTVGSKIRFELGMTDEGKPQVLRAQQIGEDGNPVVLRPPPPPPPAPLEGGESAEKKRRLEDALGLDAATMALAGGYSDGVPSTGAAAVPQGSS